MIWRAAAEASNTLILSAFDAKNTEYYLKMQYEENVNFRKFPEEVIKSLKFFAEQVISEIVTKDEMSRKAYESYTAFKKKISDWFGVTE